MRPHPILSIPLAVAVATLAVACGGSDTTTKAPGTPSASHTKPAHDLRINSELEKYVTDEWNRSVSDPADANFAAGVKVTKVTCVPETGTAMSTCVIDFSAGPPKKFGYIVAGEGTSAERAEAAG
jgi:hypothetical protein